MGGWLLCAFSSWLHRQSLCGGVTSAPLPSLLGWLGAEGAAKQPPSSRGKLCSRGSAHPVGGPMDPLGAGSTRGHPLVTQGWGWGSEKPDKNQIQVTFWLELCPRGPQPLSAAAPGAASPAGAKSRWRLVVVHSLCFNESLGAEAQLPRPGAQGMFVITGTRPCLTVPSPLTNPGAELAPRSSSAEGGRAWRASWFTGTGRAESCSSSPGQSPFSFQSRASSPRLGSQVPGALSTAPASLLARSRAPRAPLCQQPPGANFSSKIPQGKLPQAESAADRGGLGRGHPSQAGNSSCCQGPG